MEPGDRVSSRENLSPLGLKTKRGAIPTLGVRASGHGSKNPRELPDPLDLAQPCLERLVFGKHLKRRQRA